MVGNKIKEITQIIDTLRGENGCPWDKKQTAETMIYYLLEEAYELNQAILNNDTENIKEEIGDVLFQIFFIIILYEEKKSFTLKDIVDVNVKKMITRHPHVFDNLEINDVEEIKKNWDKIKKQEKNRKQDSVLDEIPKSYPPILKSYKTSKKVAKLGFDWENVDGVLSKIEEEIAELKKEISNKHDKNIETELGDVFLSLVNLSRFLKINPESALDQANKKFERRFRHIEVGAKKEGINLKDLTPKEIDDLWEKAKKI